MNPPSPTTRLMPPVIDDDDAPLSAALADIAEAVEDSVSARLELLRQRFFEDTRALAFQSLLWIAAVACFGAAWLATITAFALWLTAVAGPVVAALALGGLHLVAALVLIVAIRRRNAVSIEQGDGVGFGS
ncbi:MAG: phage holin family protein [Deltaproteobacteria bacterium]|nr:phage holin family protein [Deltaproteobacteria bacterium]